MSDVRSSEWKPMREVTIDTDVALLVSDETGTYRLPFACKRTAGGWINAKTGSHLTVEPVAWQSFPRGGIHWKAKKFAIPSTIPGAKLVNRA
jgi:hypothetical protein